MASRPRICVIGAGPAGLSAVYQLMRFPDTSDVVCYEKQNTWGGSWNLTWRVGRFGRIPGLKNNIQFRTAVRLVEYDDDNGVFHVTTADLKTGAVQHKHFSHFIVASNICCYPNRPEIPGIESFPGRVMYSHDFKHPNELKDQTILVIGAGWSAEDIAVMAFFTDGASATVDTVILATGYQTRFPFIEEKQTVSKKTSFYPEKIYKATVRMERHHDGACGRKWIPTCTAKVVEVFEDWIKYRTKADCVTNGRQGRYRSCVTGNKGKKIPAYKTLFDDSLESWLKY
ncbi:flavin-containing monooxygenase 1-like [Mya arenaria]|uniref:flavin-containing monooxygenase 1-like n=1 Tax=Mya arenaria TaxID=6604 RepID=UPI0022DF45DD|nr:flavin-containing monooxygenase 1-like [Mya arenaria]